MTTVPNATLISSGLLANSFCTRDSDICELQNHAQHTNLLLGCTPMANALTRIVEHHRNVTSIKSSNGKSTRNAACTNEESAVMGINANSATLLINQQAHIQL